ncbi:HEXXH motif domain-containing protein [Actinomadura rugatobispora]|uniref:HEXXH motif domain-containing protein n=1 Tax=Actinomadura rugatobispora TaxID=1994 RepID=A0ABW1A5C3_9ACTN|nr:HEXXH motif domain-containing protein [Actinomadura rugatobispora]
MTRHIIPGKVFYGLASGGGGAYAVGHLKAAQYSKRVLLLRAVRDAARAEGATRARRARQAYALLAEIQRTCPDAVDAVIRYPTVGVWARAALQGQGDSGALASLAAAALVRARFPRAIEVEISRESAVLPSLGRLLLPGEAEGRYVIVRTAGGRPEIAAPDARVRIPADPHGDTSMWQGLRRLDAEYHGLTIRLVLDDCDPYRTPGTPELEAAPRLAAAEVEAWRASLRRAWRLLVRGHAETAGEVAAAISVLVPLRADGPDHTSATVPMAFGAVAMSPPPDDHALAVTLAHEAQHAKLGALNDVVPLTLPDDGSRFYAPWRDDPRPVGGLLHGAYAHLGVAGYWRAERGRERGDGALRAHTEFAHWRDACALVIRTLRGCGRLTEAGEQFVAVMDRTVRAWRREPVPSVALDAARAIAERHRGRWQAAHAGRGRAPG